MRIPVDPFTPCFRPIITLLIFVRPLMALNGLSGLSACTRRRPIRYRPAAAAASPVATIRPREPRRTRLVAAATGATCPPPNAAVRHAGVFIRPPPASAPAAREHGPEPASAPAAQSATAPSTKPVLAVAAAAAVSVRYSLPVEHTSTTSPAPPASPQSYTERAILAFTAVAMAPQPDCRHGRPRRVAATMVCSSAATSGGAATTAKAEEPDTRPTSVESTTTAFAGAFRDRSPSDFAFLAGHLHQYWSRLRSFSDP